MNVYVQDEVQERAMAIKRHFKTEAEREDFEARCSEGQTFVQETFSTAMINSLRALSVCNLLIAHIGEAAKLDPKIMKVLDNNQDFNSVQSIVASAINDLSKLNPLIQQRILIAITNSPEFYDSATLAYDIEGIVCGRGVTL